MRKLPFALIAASGVIISLISPPMGVNSGSDIPTMEDARNAFEEAAPHEILGNVAPLASHISRAEDVVATVSTDTASIDSNHGELTLVAPAPDAHSRVLPVLMDGGSALFAVVIEDSSASREYRFDIEAPEGTAANIQEDGSIAFSTPSGELVAGVAAPWHVIRTSKKFRRGSR